MNPWMIAQFGMQLLQSAAAKRKEKQQIEAQRTIDEANAEASNVSRDSSNKVSAAVASLSNFAKSINNQRALTAGGAKLNALKINAGRAIDAAVQGRIGQQMQVSEQMGQVSALASAAGVGGGSVDMVRRTMALRGGILKNQAEVAIKQREADFKDAQSAGISEMVGSFDSAASVANMDYGVTQAPVRFSQSVIGGALANADFTLLRDGLFQPKAAGPVGMAGTQYNAEGTAPAASGGGGWFDFFK